MSKEARLLARLTAWRAAGTGFIVELVQPLATYQADRDVEGTFATCISLYG